MQHHAWELIDDAAAAELESDLWWLSGRRAILSRFLRLAALPPGASILEIGCGSGGDLDLLARFGDVTGVEPSPILANRARRRHDVLQGTLADVPARPFDLVCAFDVLEHLEDDRALVREVASRARPGDQLLVTVPACPWLFGHHDRMLHHYRRYSRARLRSALEGFEIRRISSFLFFLFPAAVVQRVFGSSKKEGVTLARTPRPISEILEATLRLEGALSEHVPLPIGLWLFALARRLPRLE